MNYWLTKLSMWNNMISLINSSNDVWDTADTHVSPLVETGNSSSTLPGTQADSQALEALSQPFPGTLRTPS